MVVNTETNNQPLEPIKEKRVFKITYDYWVNCGKPDVTSEIVKRAYFIGYGPAAITVLKSGISGDNGRVFTISDHMGYDPDLFEVIVKERA